MYAEHRRQGNNKRAPLARHISMREQRGAAAIEFALVFPLFFLIVYAIITYGLILVAQQSVTLAAAEGARAALRHAASDQERNDHAKDVATGPNSVAAWLGQNNLSFSGEPRPCNYSNSPAPQLNCYQVTVSYPYITKPLVPLLLGPLMGFVVPQQLSSTAIVQID